MDDDEQVQKGAQERENRSRKDCPIEHILLLEHNQRGKYFRSNFVSKLLDDTCVQAYDLETVTPILSTYTSTQGTIPVLASWDWGKPWNINDNCRYEQESNHRFISSDDSKSVL